ncbi:hypothetical protein BKA70DRAFT_1402963 [Coprinopsis sp. MPI-PUGE-AT-0042]|nr:hypothetical protein BKA70DRAFT_1402963 [Coprinopsis sp. MPI-PUGE-AT-0042]
MSKQEDAAFLVSVTRWSALWQVAGSSIVLWDHATMLDQEIEFVWLRKWSFTTFLYIVTRYVGDVAFIHGTISVFVTGEFLNKMGVDKDSRCPSVQQVQSWLGQTAFFAMNGIVIKRVVCICDSDRRVFRALTIVLAMLAVHSAISTILASGRSDSFPSWHWAFAVLMFAFDALVFGLSLLQGIRFACENRRMRCDGRKVGILEHLWRTRRTLASVLLRDSITFPIINLVLAMLIILAWIAKLHPGWMASIITATAASVPTLGCRLLLNLRTAYYKPFREEYIQSQLDNGSLVFPNSPRASAERE